MTHYDMPEDSVCLAYIHPQDLSSYFHESVLEMLEYDKLVVERISLTSGPRIASARNTVVREFLSKRRSEWLLFIDADMVFAPDTAARLVASAREVDAQVVGALCYGATPTGVMNPTLFRLIEDDGGKKFEVYENPPPKGIVKVDATGTGCVLIHRDLLLKIGEGWGNRTAWPWFFEGELEHGGRRYEFGEDIGFCIRCSVLDVPVFVNTEVEVHHHKGQIMTPRHYRQYRRTVKQGLSAEDRLTESLLFNNPPGATS